MPSVQDAARFLLTHNACTGEAAAGKWSLNSDWYEGSADNIRRIQGKEAKNHSLVLAKKMKEPPISDGDRIWAEANLLWLIGLLGSDFANKINCRACLISNILTGNFQAQRKRCEFYFEQGCPTYWNRKSKS